MVCGDHDSDAKSEEASVIGTEAVVTHPTRGADGPGEVTVRQGGGTEVYIAWSEQPLPKGTPVVIYQTRGARTVDVEPLTAGS
jgi:membrane protein implicated in regulation of membrane protease activity